jgi:hypothetical protein
MKKIPLKEVIEILENASGIVIDDNGLMYPSVDGFEDDPNHEFLKLSYTDDEGLTYEYTFYEDHNETVEIVGSSMFLIDEDGETCQITILAEKYLE